MCFQYEDMDGFMVPKKSVPQPKAYTIGDAIVFFQERIFSVGRVTVQQTFCC